MMRFTDKQIKALKPADKKYYTREAQGFAIRVMPSGVKTWLYIYTWKGQRKEMNLGNYPEVKLGDARIRHGEAYKALKNDIDPAVGRGADKEAKTVGDLIDDYIERWAKPRKKSWEEDQRNLENDVRKRLGKKLVNEVTRQDILQLLEAMYKRKVTRQASIVFSVVRRMFNFAIEQGYPGLEFSPCDRVKPRIADKRKDRWLTEAEIRRVWHDLPLTNIHGSTYRCLLLILLTGQRPGECLVIQKNEIDGDWWTIPASKTKNGIEQRVFLTDKAKELIGNTDPPFPVPANTSALSYALRRARDPKRKSNRLKVEPFTPHDLRRTAATHMAALGVTDFVIGQVLNHKEQSVTSIYNRYQYDKEKKQALIAWETKLLDIINKKEGKS